MTADGSTSGIVVAIDTGTGNAVVSLGSADGRLIASTTWLAGFRHGEELLQRLEGLLGEARISRADLVAVGVGTGPGAFTGLRVGIATAKGIAHGLGLQIVGVPTSAALLAASRSAGLADPLALLLPAGPSDRVVIETDATGIAAEPRRIGAGEAWQPLAAATVVAIDLEGRAPDEAVAAGAEVRSGFPAALLGLAAARVRSGDVDDLGSLVPVYVTPPRGVLRESDPAVVSVVPG